MLIIIIIKYKLIMTWWYNVINIYEDKSEYRNHKFLYKSNINKDFKLNPMLLEIEIN